MTRERTRKRLFEEKAMKRKLTMKEINKISSVLDLLPAPKLGEEGIDIKLGYIRANLVGSPKMVFVGSKKEKP